MRECHFIRAVSETNRVAHQMFQPYGLRKCIRNVEIELEINIGFQVESILLAKLEDRSPGKDLGHRTNPE